MAIFEESCNEHTTKEPNVLELIEKNYRQLNQMMVEEIEIASAHGGITGSGREMMWMKFFRNIIPLKYSLAQGVIIIDSHNNRSREVDIAVYDEQYTPYVFQHNTLKFIPIEAVVIAIECKSDKWKDDGLIKWAESIRELKATASGVARMATGYISGLTNLTQQQTRPILILASNFKRVNEDTIHANIDKIKNSFDFILLKQSVSRSNGATSQFKLVVPSEKEKLGWWGSRLNGSQEEDNLKIVVTQDHRIRLKEAKESGKYSELKISEEYDSLENTLLDLRIPDNELLTLNFQLNQLLMLLNNPMMFPHFAYAKAFKKIGENKKL